MRAFCIYKHLYMTEISKLISYAYPNSPLAIQKGFGNTGCWFIALYPAIDAHFGGMPLDETFTTDKEQAIKYAAQRPEPFNIMHKYFK